MLQRLRGKKKDEVPQANAAVENSESEESEEEYQRLSSDDDAQKVKVEKPLKKAKQENSDLVPIRRASPMVFSSTEQHESQFNIHHRITMGILVSACMSWIIGIEVLCLWKSACSIPSTTSPSMNLDSTIEPSVPLNGVWWSFPSASVTIFFIAPVLVYLVRSELKRNAQLAVGISMLTSIYMFIICGLFFGASASIDWENNPRAQRYYHGNQAAAESDASQSTSGFGVLFMMNGLLFMGLSLYSLFLCRLFPRKLKRMNILPVTSKDIKSNDELDPFIETEKSSIKREKGSRSKEKKKKSKKREKPVAVESDDDDL